MRDLPLSGSGTQLEQVIVHVRRRYSEVVGKCAECLANVLQAEGFKVEEVFHQRDVFRKKVRPHISESKTAYILVDALRYERGLELIDGLKEGFDVRIVPGIAQLPTITEVGMAALLPNADMGMELVDIGSGRVGEIGRAHV